MKSEYKKETLMVAAVCNCASEEYEASLCQKPSELPRSIVKFARPWLDLASLSLRFAKLLCDKQQL